ncbi:MAG: hypothetical protein KKF50_03615 [Nanoarchaeota archaeon]|nr:hypothetical protein [Nanoarchaeota archaeon]
MPSSDKMEKKVSLKKLSCFSRGNSRKKAQLTIFIIVAMLIVVAILGLIFIRGGEKIGKVHIEDPKQFIRKCVADAVEDALPVILKNGGVIDPENIVTYQDEEYNYLCYQAEYYKHCINTHPMLESRIEKEIKEYTRQAVQYCFDSMREDYESRGFDVSGGSTDYSIDLLPGMIEIRLRKNVEISREGSSELVDVFDTYVNTPLYWLTMIARDIINDEASNCDVNYNEYVLMYPKYKISKTNYDFSEIYIIEDRNTRDEFKFAVRGCAFAPGL